LSCKLDGGAYAGNKTHQRANPIISRIIKNPAYKGLTIGWKYRSLGKGRMELRPEEDWIIFDSSVTPRSSRPTFGRWPMTD
jgi:hypothetical protein